MRAYMADLRALSGETVASSALLPVWQPKPTTYWGAPPIPGSRPLKVAGAWKVGLVTRWRAVGLGARVDIKLVHQRRNYGQNVATLARVWVRCHLADVEGTK
jgi:hypothetical protein